MSLMLLLGAGLLCVAMIMALSMIGVVTAERRGVARSVAAVQALDSAPTVLKQEVEQPFADRVIAPLAQSMDGADRGTRAELMVMLGIGYTTMRMVLPVADEEAGESETLSDWMVDPVQSLVDWRAAARG